MLRASDLPLAVDSTWTSERAAIPKENFLFLAAEWGCTIAQVKFAAEGGNWSHAAMKRFLYRRGFLPDCARKDHIDSSGNLVRGRSLAALYSSSHVPLPSGETVSRRTVPRSAIAWYETPLLERTPYGNARSISN